MKGLLGVLSDGIPIRGLHKRPYLIFAGFVGTASVLLLALVPLDVGISIPFLFPLLFFGGNLQASTMDLLCEGMYSRFMVEKPESKSDVVSFVWVSIMTGALIASCIVGPVADNLGASAIFWFALPFAVQALIPTLSGFLPEEVVGHGCFPPRYQKSLDGRILTLDEIELRNDLRAEEQRRAKGAGQTGAFIMAISMACGAMGQAAMASFAGYTPTFIYCMCVSSTLSVMCFFCLNTTLAKCNLYMFLGDALYLSIAGALDFWYTADNSCVPGGPGFGYTYYNTYTQVVGTLASLVGIWMFQNWMSEWKLRRVFWLSTLLKVVASFVDLIIVKRWNRDYLHIDDHWAYMLGDAIIQRVCEMLNFMPAVVLTSKLCPKYIEATVFAVLAGFSNFGQAVAKSAGVVAIQAFGVSTKAPDCNFDALPWLITVAHGMIPLLAIPLTFLLIPNKKLSDSFQDEDESMGSSGSGDILSQRAREMEGLADEEQFGIKDENNQQREHHHRKSNGEDSQFDDDNYEGSSILSESQRQLAKKIGHSAEFDGPFSAPTALNQIKLDPEGGHIWRAIDSRLTMAESFGVHEEGSEGSDSSLKPMSYQGGQSNRDDGQRKARKSSRASIVPLGNVTRSAAAVLQNSQQGVEEGEATRRKSLEKRKKNELDVHAASGMHGGGTGDFL